MLLWPSWCIVLTDVVMHVAALLLCWIRIQGGGGGGSSSNITIYDGSSNNKLNQQQQHQPLSSPLRLNSPHTTPTPTTTTDSDDGLRNMVGHHTKSSSFGAAVVGGGDGIIRTTSPSSSALLGGGGGGDNCSSITYKHATVQIGDATTTTMSSEQLNSNKGGGGSCNNNNNSSMARPPPPQLMVVLPWVQAIGSMTSVMSNSWTFYYRLSEVVYTALLFIGDMWVGIQCATTSSTISTSGSGGGSNNNNKSSTSTSTIGTSRSTSSSSSSLPRWKCGAACMMAVLILFFAIEVVSLGAMPPTLPHSAEVYMRHHQCGFYHPSRILVMMDEQGGSGDSTSSTTTTNSITPSPLSSVPSNNEDPSTSSSVAGTPTTGGQPIATTSTTSPPAASSMTPTPLDGEIDLVEAEIQKHAVPGESPSSTIVRRQLAATDIPLEILGRIAGYVSGSCNCIVAGCAIASLVKLLRRVVVVGSGGAIPSSTTSITTTNSNSGIVGPYPIWAMMMMGRGSGGGGNNGNAVDSTSSYFVPLPTVFETFLGALCALAYVAMLQQEYDDTFYASHAEMMRWYICTIATLVHNITIGITAIVHRQRHRLVFLEVFGTAGVSRLGSRYNTITTTHHHNLTNKQSQSLLLTMTVVMKMGLVIPCACWYDVVATFKRLRVAILH